VCPPPRLGEIISKLREAEVELAKGQTVAEVCRKLAVLGNGMWREFGVLEERR
jgi:hypothetical protein